MRPEILFPLFAPTGSLPGVGAALEARLRKLGIIRLLDLVFHRPIGIIERARIDDLTTIPESGIATVCVTVVGRELGRRARSPAKILTQDAQGEALNLIYFSASRNWLARSFGEGRQICVSGKIERFQGRLQIVHPDYVEPATRASQIPLREPIYPLTEGLRNKRLHQLVCTALERIPNLPEWTDPDVVQSNGWQSWKDSLRHMHRIDGSDDGDPPERLAYDELLAGQLALLLRRDRHRRSKCQALLGIGTREGPEDGTMIGQLRLPFVLTGAQQRVIAEISRDLEKTSPMLRMLQGDVGSGKTVVALHAMIQAMEAGCQAALLAPTEILARQHHERLTNMLESLDIQPVLLLGAERSGKRTQTLEQIASGAKKLIIGTHALLQESVKFHNLGLAVIDEQHRFGVEQRLQLIRKAREKIAHLLLMTATPIPRTLSLVHYGEMDLSILDERPASRPRVDTRVMVQDRMDALLDGLDRVLKQGRRAYWVCPLVEESENSDITAATRRFEMLLERFPGKVGLVHGRMKAQDRNLAMARFADGSLALLVATTVIEVGVDIPAASLMIVEESERFGLAQLHQLRGRVGRGSEHSTCILLRRPEISEVARARLELMRECDDGFIIAEEDLRLRGSGEILGTRQSGFPAFKIADSKLAGRLVTTARKDAQRVLNKDPALQQDRGQALRLLLHLFERPDAIVFLDAG